MFFQNTLKAVACAGALCAMLAVPVPVYAQSVPVSSEGSHEGEVTQYMACRDFMGMIAEDSARTKVNFSLESNAILERHTSQMMEMLQPYAVVDQNGKPLDYTWSFLVEKVGSYCESHPDSHLDDAIQYAGKSIFDLYLKAKDALLSDAHKAAAHPQMLDPKDLGEDAPPAGIPGNTVQGPK